MTSSPHVRIPDNADVVRYLDVREARPYRVSALVSAYRSAEFFRGCLEDLARQTLFIRGELEIVVVDSASPEDEWALAEGFASRHRHLVAVRTPERESLYAAWNRAIALSRGSFLTSANTDDRHHPRALEILADALERNPDSALAYGDVLAADRLFDRFEDFPTRRVFRYPDYFAPSALLHYQFGPQMMWRRSVHNLMGGFDSSFRAAGDWEFNLRLAHRFRAEHLPLILGAYYERPGAITFRDDAMERENRALMDGWHRPGVVAALYAQAAVGPADSAEVLMDMGVRALEYYPPWREGHPERNLKLAQICFRAALRFYPNHPGATSNLGLCAALAGHYAAASRLWTAASAAGCPEARANLQTLNALPNGRRLWAVARSGLALPDQRTLARLDFAPSLPSVPAAHRTHKQERFRLTFIVPSGRINLEGVSGGLETAVGHLTDELARRGHKVSLIADFTGDLLAPSQVTRRQLGDWLKGTQPDPLSAADFVVVTSGPGEAVWNRLQDAPPLLVWFHHQNLSFMGAPDSAGLLNRAEAVVCVSRAVAGALASAKVRPDRMRVIPNGLDAARFYTEPGAVRQPKRLVFVGALVADKGPDVAVRAFLTLQGSHPDAELHLFGSAALWGAPEFLNPRVITARCPRIFFHGPVPPDRLAQEYRRAALCLIPSRYESFSLVSLEAQACGCVPVAAEVGGVPETMIPGVTGFLYPPGDESVLISLLDGLLKNPELVAKAGRSGAEFVKHRFSWARTADQFENLLRAL